MRSLNLFARGKCWRILKIASLTEVNAGEISKLPDMLDMISLDLFDRGKRS